MLTPEQLCGQEIFIQCLKLECVDCQITLSLGICFKNNRWNLVFRNVSSLCLDHFSFPLQVSGLEITDNFAKGWQSDVRYLVEDAEEGKLSFYCSSVEIFT